MDDAHRSYACWKDKKKLIIKVIDRVLVIPALTFICGQNKEKMKTFIRIDSLFDLEGKLFRFN